MVDQRDKLILLKPTSCIGGSARVFEATEVMKIRMAKYYIECYN